LFKNNIEVKEKEVTEYLIKYFIDSKGNALTVHTTSLETIFADVALAVNPQDKRYKKLI
jgi:valyl-tRNA synthetase